MALVPVFISASSFARFFHKVDADVLDNCLLFFGSEPSWLFAEPKASRPEPYRSFPLSLDAFIRKKYDQGKLHLLKPEGWQEGQRCDFQMASQFFQGLGFGPLPTTLAHFEQTGWSWPSGDATTEAQQHLPKSHSQALRQIKINYDEAEKGTGCYGHDYGPVMEMVRLTDERLFPILSENGLQEFLSRGDIEPK
eukprot:gnl/TRDRNA2_/TRDRNA2_166863_c0_seq2.p1 gnl/TRDRNA2_/TRDRNA2_166863_c0~~gnl/TRDRNA2_/TRDRNA2_166863_c0_seq2.p1  ORF type:complete len:194 (-),score=22.37 gnl/TRDRNA2_/TRDRNA2_166863_c0_seq2:295-876(-)